MAFAVFQDCNIKTIMNYKDNTHNTHNTYPPHSPTHSHNINKQLVYIKVLVNFYVLLKRRTFCMHWIQLRSLYLAKTTNKKRAPSTVQLCIEFCWSFYANSVLAKYGCFFFGTVSKYLQKYLVNANFLNNRQMLIMTNIKSRIK